MRGSFRNRTKYAWIWDNVIIVILVSTIWLFICAVEGVYPFGNLSLAVGDMQEQYIPMYTHLWDVMHGEKVLFFDFLTGFGTNITGDVLHFSLLSPFNIFFAFIARDSVDIDDVYLYFGQVGSNWL